MYKIHTCNERTKEKRERERERIKNYPEFTPDGFCVVLTPSRRVTSRRLLIVRRLLTTGSPVHDRTSRPRALSSGDAPSFNLERL